MANQKYTLRDVSVFVMTTPGTTPVYSEIACDNITLSNARESADVTDLRSSGREYIPIFSNKTLEFEYLRLFDSETGVEDTAQATLGTASDTPGGGGFASFKVLAPGGNYTTFDGVVALNPISAGGITDGLKARCTVTGIKNILKVTPTA